MSETDSGVLDGVGAGGPRNPPSAHCCDVCGVKLPMQCPFAHAINRRQANFCSNCGIALRDERQTYATPSSGPLGPSPDSAPATESDSASVPRQPFVPAHTAATEVFDLPASFDPFPWTAESAKKLVSDKDEDAERLKQIDRFKQRRRRRRRMGGWLGNRSGGLAGRV